MITTTTTTTTTSSSSTAVVVLPLVVVVVVAAAANDKKLKGRYICTCTHNNTNNAFLLPPFILGIDVGFVVQEVASNFQMAVSSRIVEGCESLPLDMDTIDTTGVFLDQHHHI